MINGQKQRPPQRKTVPPRGMVSALSCELKTCRKVEAAPGGRWTGGILPPGTRTVSEREKSSYAAHFMGRLALKLSSISVAPFKFLIPPLACALNRMGAPRDKPLGCCGEACRGFVALR
jgi:hypothetical protein